MKEFDNPEVAFVFETYPQKIRGKLMFLRQLIFETASEIENFAELIETLKWGEPSYLSSQSKMSSTLRIDWKEKCPDQYAIYFHCKTELVDTFRKLYPEKFIFEGDRALIFNTKDEIPIKELKHCIFLSLTYHQRKRLWKFAL